jgi:hypothetical protein
MTTLSPDPRPLQASLLLPPIAHLPTPVRIREPARPCAPDTLDGYLRTTRSWDRNLVEVSSSVTGALWAVVAGAGAVGGWLAAVRAGAAPCSGTVCRIATLGHPGLLLVLAGGCVVVLLGLAPFTRGLTRAGSLELAAMTLAGVAGVMSALGVVAVAVLGLVAVFLAVAALVAVVERG